MWMSSPHERDGIRIAKFAVGARWFRRQLAPPGLMASPKKKVELFQELQDKLK